MFQINCLTWLIEQQKKALRKFGLRGNGTHCTKTKLHELIARGKIARKINFARRYFCTRTNLHQGSILHELQFCTEGHFCTRVEKN